jgi:hypothetical protein
MESILPEGTVIEVVKWSITHRASQLCRKQFLAANQTGIFPVAEIVSSLAGFF